MGEIIQFRGRGLGVVLWLFCGLAAHGQTKPVLERAHGDPFVGGRPPPSLSPSAALPPVQAAPAPVIVPVAPQAPDLGLTYAGQILPPGGARQVFVLQSNEQWLMLQAGMVMPNGYRVQAIEESQVVFHYPPLDKVAHLPLPPSPAFEVR